jgi:hypothetical protein
LGDVVGSGDSSATDGASGDSGAPTKCFEVFGTGSDETCGFSEISGFACSAGFSAGVCPSSDLVGCCVTDLSSTVGTSITGVCYYSSTLATTAMSACVGTDETWKTTAP